MGKMWVRRSGYRTGDTERDAGDGRRDSEFQNNMKMEEQSLIEMWMEEKTDKYADTRNNMRKSDEEEPSEIW
jgi:hypothetical protein